MFATFFFQMWQRRPFSYTVRTVDPAKSSETSSGQQVLVVREQLFQYKGKIYMLASHPRERLGKIMSTVRPDISQDWIIFLTVIYLILTMTTTHYETK
ncbi:MAG: hypothetical protein WCD19_08300 [Nitrososphaeraceae archaeon]